jgi:hypothetical protein
MILLFDPCKFINEEKNIIFFKIISNLKNFKEFYDTKTTFLIILLIFLVFSSFQIQINLLFLFRIYSNFFKNIKNFLKRDRNKDILKRIKKLYIF